MIQARNADTTTLALAFLAFQWSFLLLSFVYYTSGFVLDFYILLSQIVCVFAIFPLISPLPYSCAAVWLKEGSFTLVVEFSRFESNLATFMSIAIT